MKCGDISNRPYPTIAFRLESLLLVKKEEKNVAEKLLNVFRGKYEINSAVMSLVESITRKSSYRVVIISLSPNGRLLREYNRLTDDLLINPKVITSYKPRDVTLKLLTGSIMYYVDNDLPMLYNVGSRYGITLDSFQRIYYNKSAFRGYKF